MDDLDPARSCLVVEEMTGSLGSEKSATGAEPSKYTPSLQLLIGLRSKGPEQQSPTTMPSNLPDSLTGESNLQKARESAPTNQAESSPSIESPNASSWQVLSLVPNSTSGHTLPFLPWLVLNIQAPSLAPIVPTLFTNFESGTYTSVNVHFGKCKVPALQSLQEKEHECNPPS